MADLWTKEEAEKELKKLFLVVNIMPSNAKICSKCHVIYEGARKNCYCDYDSPYIDR